MATQIRIKKLTLVNFKGAKQVSVEFPTDTTTISGRNGTGKTTIMDAFLWLMWGTNSQDQTAQKFGIKTNAKDGTVQLELNPEVEGQFEIVDTDSGTLEALTLRRRWTSQWRTQKGETEREFKGNKGEYFVNDVPKTEAEYNLRVSELISPEIFKAITNPYYFANLHWKEKRELLLTMAGNVTYTDIAQQRQAFVDLLNALTGKTVEDYDIEIATEISKINKQLNDIPGRKEEIRNNTPITPDYAALEAERTQLQQELNDLIAALASESDRSRQAQERQQAIYAQIEKIRKEQADILMQAQHTARADAEAANSRHREAAQHLQNVENSHQKVQLDIRSQRSTVESQRAYAETQRANTERQKEQLKAQWYAIDAEVFTKEPTLVCPIFRHACQDVAACNQYAQNWREAEAMFNDDKYAREDAITKQGQSLAEAIQRLVQDIAAYDQQLQDLDTRSREEQATYEFNLTLAKKALAESPETPIPTIKGSDIPLWVTKEHEISDLSKTLQGFEPTEPTQEVNDKLSRKNAIMMRLAEIDRKLGLKGVIDGMTTRLAQLDKEEQRLLQRRADLQKQEATIDAMSKARMAEVERRINGMFSLVRFQMFEPTTTTKEEKPNCVCWVDGVRYTDTNRAMQVNAGIDIINTLCAYHHVTAPIFIDNAECVNEFIPTESQLILLKVSEDEQLKIQGNGYN